MVARLATTARWLCVAVLVATVLAGSAPGVAAKAKLAMNHPRNKATVFGHQVEVDVTITKAKAEERDPATGLLLCLAVSWVPEEDQWECRGYPENGQFTTLLPLPSNTTVGWYRVMAQLATREGRPVGSIITSRVYVPFVPRKLMSGEARTLDAIWGGDAPEWTEFDESQLAHAASAIFVWKNRNTRFATITSPKAAGGKDGTRTVRLRANKAGEAELDLVIDYAATFAESMVPQLCLTIDRGVQHTCRNITTRVGIPALGVGTHFVAVQVRSGDGEYFGVWDEIRLVVKPPVGAKGDATKPHHISKVTVTPNMLEPALLDALIAAANEAGLEAQTRPTALTARAPGLLADKVSLQSGSNSTLHVSNAVRLPTDYNDAVWEAAKVIAKAAGAPVVNLEPMIVQRFRRHHQYTQVYDALHCSPNGNINCGSAGQRTHAVVVYLASTDAGSGGDTVFPMLATSVSPEAGTGLVWPTCSVRVGEVECVKGDKMLRLGAPIGRAGAEVYTLTAWLRTNPVSVDHRRVRLGASAGEL